MEECIHGRVYTWRSVHKRGRLNTKKNTYRNTQGRVNAGEEEYTLWSVYTEESPHGESTLGGVYWEESTHKEVYTRGEHKWEEHTRKRAHMEESCPHRGESVHTQEYTRKRAHTKECTHGESIRRSIHGESAHGGVHTGRAHLEEYTREEQIRGEHARDFYESL